MLRTIASTSIMLFGVAVSQYYLNARINCAGANMMITSTANNKNKNALWLWLRSLFLRLSGTHATKKEKKSVLKKARPMAAMRCYFSDDYYHYHVPIHEVMENPNDPTDVKALDASGEWTYRHLYNRQLLKPRPRQMAIAEYNAKEEKENKGRSLTKKVQFAAKRRVRWFAVLDFTPIASQDEDEDANEKDNEDVKIKAARLVDVCHKKASELLLAVGIPTAEKIMDIMNELTPIMEAECACAATKEEAVRQARDLQDRGESRLEFILTTLKSKPKFSVQQLHRRRAMSEVWDAEEEAEFEEALLTRVPDVLIQRYLRRRTDKSTMGIEVTPRNVAALRITKAVLRRCAA